MKRSHLYLTILVIAVLEFTVLNRIIFFNVQPDLLLISVVFFSLSFNTKRALELGIVAGLIRDFMSTGFFGINTLLFGIIAGLVSFYSDKIYKDFFLTQLLLMIAAGSFFYLGNIGFRFIIGSAGSLEFLGSLVLVVIPAVFYTSLVSPLVFFILNRVFRTARMRIT